MAKEEKVTIVRLQFYARGKHKTWSGGSMGRWKDRDIRDVTPAIADNLLKYHSEYFKVVSDKATASPLSDVDDKDAARGVGVPSSNKAQSQPGSDKSGSNDDGDGKDKDSYGKRR